MDYTLKLTDEEMNRLIMVLEWYRDNELPNRAKRAVFYANTNRDDEMFKDIAQSELKHFARESNAVFSILNKAEELYD